MDIERQTTQQNPESGSTEVVHTKEYVPSESVVRENQANKMDAYVWYVVAVIDVLLILRFLFLLFGAQNTGFTSLLYNVSSPFITIFKGIFTSPGSQTGYFDTASVLAAVIYVLLGWGIVSLIDISRRSKVR